MGGEEEQPRIDEAEEIFVASLLSRPDFLHAVIQIDPLNKLMNQR